MAPKPEDCTEAVKSALYPNEPELRGRPAGDPPPEHPFQTWLRQAHSVALPDKQATFDAWIEMAEYQGCTKALKAYLWEAFLAGWDASLASLLEKLEQLDTDDSPSTE